MITLAIDADGPSENCGKSHKSEYELTQEANIAKNKELLCQLGLQFGQGDKTEKVSDKKGKKAKKETKKMEAPSQSSPRVEIR
jgi:hypothetical protein